VVIPVVYKLQVAVAVVPSFNERAPFPAQDPSVAYETCISVGIPVREMLQNRDGIELRMDSNFLGSNILTGPGSPGPWLGQIRVNFLTPFDDE
jgi:hypothetical protein